MSEKGDHGANEGQVAPTSSLTPIGIGPPLVIGSGTNVMATGSTNVWPAVQTEQAVVVSPFKYSTPIVLPTQSGLFP